MKTFKRIVFLTSKCLVATIYYFSVTPAFEKWGVMEAECLFGMLEFGLEIKILIIIRSRKIFI